MKRTSIIDYIVWLYRYAKAITYAYPVDIPCRCCGGRIRLFRSKLTYRLLAATHHKPLCIWCGPERRSGVLVDG